MNSRRGQHRLAAGQQPLVGSRCGQSPGRRVPCPPPHRAKRKQCRCSKRICILVLCTALVFFVVCTFVALLTGNGSSSSSSKQGIAKTGSYDYIVVGSGPAGAAVVHQLLKNSHNSVLLLEAGRDEDEAVRTDDIAGQNTDSPGYNYICHTDARRETIGRSVSTPWSRIKGGCSAHNSGQTWVGSERWWNRWHQRTGGPWSAQNAYAAIGSISRTLAMNGTVLRGDGPINITHIFQDAANTVAEQILGKPEYGGFVQPEVNFAFDGQTVFLGTGRSFSSDLLPERSTKKYNFQEEAIVRRVIFDGYKAKGVEYSQYGAMKYAHAKKAVVLTAGVMGTAQILHYSGVGPDEILNELRVEPRVATLPVGLNYVDQDLFNVFGACNFSEAGTPPFLRRVMLPLSTDLQSDVGLGSFTAFVPTNGCAVFTQFVYNDIKDTSGRIGANYRDPSMGNYLWRPNYGGNDADQEELSEMARTVRRYWDDLIAATSPSTIPFTSPEFYDPTFNDDTEEAKALRLQWINGVIEPGIHDSSSCRMGPNDGTNVVDAFGRVHNVHNLYVADTSIIPITNEFGTQGPAYITGTIIGKQLLDGGEPFPDPGQLLFPRQSATLTTSDDGSAQSFATSVEHSDDDTAAALQSTYAQFGQTISESRAKYFVRTGLAQHAEK